MASCTAALAMRPASSPLEAANSGTGATAVVGGERDQHAVLPEAVVQVAEEFGQLPVRPHA